MENNADVAKALQTLAREEMITRLLQDIQADIAICKLEGWDYRPYIRKIKSIMDEFLRAGKVKKEEIIKELNLF